ncbi:hypothetical protein I4000191A8_08000 [Clostridia bacterium i40-0019-1A8]
MRSGIPLFDLKLTWLNLRKLDIVKDTDAIIIKTTWGSPCSIGWSVLAPNQLGNVVANTYPFIQAWKGSIC